MSIQVSQVVLHQFKLNEQSAQKLTTQLREELLDCSDEVNQLLLQLHQAYQSKNKAYAIFQDNSIFAQELNRYLEQELDFLTFSHICAKTLAQELGKYPFADSGTFILCQYNFLATDYLFIALLDSKNSVLVDEKLEVKSTSYLELLQFDIAARINLTELKLSANSNRYLTFLKGRIGRKIGDFFMDFLGAEQGLDPKTQNQCLLQAVNDYCQQGELTQEQSQAIKKQVFDYCQEQLSNNDEIVIQELSETLPTLNQQDFSTFTTNQGYELEQSIPPVKATLKSLTKFSGSGKGVTISFDANLLNSRVIWDESSDTLLIKELPANLKDQLQKQFNQ